MSAASHQPETPGPDQTPLEDVAGRLDAALAGIAELSAADRQLAQSAVEGLNELHRQALTTIIKRLKSDDRGRELLFELVDDPGVRMMFAMHSLIRPDPETAARQALDQVRPGLQSHGGNVEFSHYADGVVYVRLEGACNGCSMAAVTMREGVEQAVLAAVPGVTAVEVVPNEPGPTLISVDSLLQASREERDDQATQLRESGWARTHPIDAVPVGELRTAEVAAASGVERAVIVLNLDGQFHAFDNACAHQGRPLDEAIIDLSAGTLTCPWHGLCFAADSGECLTLPGAQLTPLPVQLAAGHVWVRPED